MTAHELAKILLEGPDLMVTVRGYESGVDEIKSVEKPRLLYLKFHDGEYYFGEHTYDYYGIKECETVLAI
jgi:hypothetical protein